MSFQSYRLPDQKCPVCDRNGLLVNEHQYEEPGFGNILLTLTRCEQCGYKHKEILPLSVRGEPIAVSAKIKTSQDLNIRVIRSSSATVSIPEFGAEISPGLYSEGYVTNIEGVLEKVEETLRGMLGGVSGTRLRRAHRLLVKLQKARNGRQPFTLTIRDPLGNSAIVTSDSRMVRRRRLTFRELRNLKFGEYALVGSQAST